MSGIFKLQSQEDIIAALKLLHAFVQQLSIRVEDLEKKHLPVAGIESRLEKVESSQAIILDRRVADFLSNPDCIARIQDALKDDSASRREAVDECKRAREEIGSLKSDIRPMIALTKALKDAVRDDFDYFDY